MDVESRASRTVIQPGFLFYQVENGSYLPWLKPFFCPEGPKSWLDWSPGGLGSGTPGLQDQCTGTRACLYSKEWATSSLFCCASFICRLLYPPPIFYVRERKGLLTPNLHEPYRVLFFRRERSHQNHHTTFYAVKYMLPSCHVCSSAKKRQRWADPRGFCVKLNDVTCCLHRNLSELPKTQLVNVDLTSAEPSLSDEGDRPVCLLLKASKFHWNKRMVGLDQPDFTFKPSISWGGLLVTCFIVHTDTEYTCTDDTCTHAYTNLLKHRRAHARWHTCMQVHTTS